MKIPITMRQLLLFGSCMTLAGWMNTASADVCVPTDPNYNPDDPICLTNPPPCDPNVNPACQDPVEPPACDPNVNPACQDPVEPPACDPNVNPACQDPVEPPACDPNVNPACQDPVEPPACDPNVNPACQDPVDPQACDPNVDPACQDSVDPAACDPNVNPGCTTNTPPPIDCSLLINKDMPECTGEQPKFCMDAPERGLFCDEFGHKVCRVDLIRPGFLSCEDVPGVCVEDPSKNLFCDERGKQLCFPDEELGISCGDVQCEENPDEGIYCDAKGHPICEENPLKGIFCHEIPPACIHDPDNGMTCDANHNQGFVCIDDNDPNNNVSCDDQGRLCVTIPSGETFCEEDGLFDPAQFNSPDLIVDPALFNFFDEEDITQLPPEFFIGITPEQFDEFRPDAYGHLNSGQVQALPLDVLMDMDGQEFFNFPPDVFDDFSQEQIGALPPKALRGLTPTQFNRLNPDALQGLDRHDIAALPPELWMDIQQDVFFGLPDDAFQGMDHEDCENLPPLMFGQMDAAKVGNLGGDCLMGMDSEQFMQLPDAALAGLGADHLHGLPPRVFNDWTPERFDALPDAALTQLAQENPFEMLEILANLDTIAADGVSADDLALVEGFLPPGVSIDPNTGELLFTGNEFDGQRLPMPILEFGADVFGSDIDFRLEPHNLAKGFGLGGAGEPALDQMDRVMADFFPGFGFKQDAEGFISLDGEGDFAGIGFDLMLTPDAIREAPEGTPEGITEDPMTGEFLVTTDHGKQFGVSFGPPNMTCMAKALGVGDTNNPGSQLSMDQNGIAVFMPATTSGTSNRRQFSNNPQSFKPSGGSSNFRRSQQAAGLYTYPARRTGENPFAELVYGQDTGVEECAGLTQTVYPTVPDADLFMEMLANLLGIPTTDIYQRVDGSFRVQLGPDLYDIVPDFVTEAPNIARGTEQATQLATDAAGNFMMDAQDRFILHAPYQSRKLVIPLILKVVVPQ
ncbi:hypothetical protein [Candidatus Venteria ishoeyi]|uniref:Uncharacterized protein n=1 Tax=Candidatus Venteria ishoeyi TaxID=1899563 RepID=A0A1H6FC31_9GAMM|nr:hypothetical protein [Candidatus Venteria ishoeyi]SEH06565.1 Uncharacterised protein [Candidatus Venteria ishoeyi]